MATPSKKTKLKFLSSTRERFNKFRDRRPHRTFQLSRRRDSVRPLELPGFISFTAHVSKTFWRYKKQLLGLALISAVSTGLLIGISSQGAYSAVVDTLQETGSEFLQGSWGELERAVSVLISISGMNFSGDLTNVQQLYSVVVFLFTWMTAVWILRSLLANRKTNLRDAIYSASAPFVSTLVLALVLIVQLLPAGLAAIAYSAAAATGLLAGGVEAMLFWVAAGSLFLLSLFWIMSTLFAMVIVTLPGTYPFKALAIAGDMMLGRRTKILNRVLWMMLCVALAWVAVLLPVILIDGWLKGAWDWISWLPIVPLTLLAMTSLSSVWVSTYIYLLYRKVVDEDARHE